MAENKNVKSYIAVIGLVLVIIGVIVAAVLTNKEEAKPAASNQPVSFSMGLGQEYAYPKGDKKRIRIKSADKEIVSVKDGKLIAAALGTTTVAVNGEKMEVTVLDPPSEIAFPNENLSLGIGEAAAVKADMPKSPNLVGIDYQVSDDKVVSLEGGKLTALSQGKATVTATAYNGIKAVCQVSVSKAPESLLYNGDITICVGRSKELRPSLPDGCAASVITYETSNPDVLKIESNGNATAVAEGEADITATAYNGVSATCHVVVETIPYYVRPNLDPNKPMIAFTFDDGPNKASTSVILDTLEQNGGSATFFIVGNRLKSDGNADCAKRMVSLGCQLGNHTYDHTHYGKNVCLEDITWCIDEIENVTGHKPTAFRPTGGALTDFIEENARAPLYIWSLDTLDWKYRDSNRIYNVLTTEAKDGDIVLMHDIYKTTAEAVSSAVPVLVQNGYQIVNVAELSYYKGHEVENGQVYYSFK